MLLPLIRQITDPRPSYGYRRVTVLLNHKLHEQGLNRVNHKRVYRIMKENSLLLQRYGKKPTRHHDGKVVTLKRNMRWCSDVFGLQCDNGDKVYIAFVLDTCDREAIGYIASTRGIDGQAIRDLMLECVEKRFKSHKLNHRIQWLSDNGPCYTARQTVLFARTLGFEVCTTAAYSPQSNGVAESFVKSFKRDYAYHADLSSAGIVMASLNQWFEDYNEWAPHKGLNMKSPRQFIREMDKSA